MSDSLLPTFESETTSLERGYSALRETCGILTRLPFQFLKISGEDRKAWLQGQFTNDLRKLNDWGSIEGCFCSATGQLVALCRVWSLGEDYVLAAHVQAVPSIIERIQTHVVMEDVAATALADEQLLSIQGPRASDCLSKAFALPTLDAGTFSLGGQEGIVLRSDRSGYGGWDILIAKSGMKELRKALQDLPLVSDEALDAAQIEAGIARFGVDTDSRTLPPELGEHLESKLISYSKGCYTGQEILMRIHSRGHTNRSWVGLICDVPPSIGDEVKSVDGHVIGKITRSAESPQFGPIAAGFVKKEFASSGQIVVVQGRLGPEQAEIHLMPILGLD